MTTVKETQVVMLVTEKAHNALLKKGQYLQPYNKGLYTQDYLSIDNRKSHHLYFLSDEKIKEGDWYIADNKIYKASVDHMSELYQYPCNKIIATTNTELNLPRPSDAFIQKYIEEYNKGNVIDKVLVEYTGIITGIANYIYSNGELPVVVPILKVAPDNTITIKPVVETWDDILRNLNQHIPEELIDHLIESLNESYNPPTKIK